MATTFRRLGVEAGEDEILIEPIAAIDRESMVAILDDGRITPFTEMYGEHGDDVTDTDDAVTVVIKHPDGPWVVLDLEWFDAITRH